MEEQELQIFLHDFTPEAQERILSFYGLENAQAGNLDIVPITSLCYDALEMEPSPEIISKEQMLMTIRQMLTNKPSLKRR